MQRNKDEEREGVNKIERLLVLEICSEEVDYAREMATTDSHTK